MSDNSLFNSLFETVIKKPLTAKEKKEAKEEAEKRAAKDTPEHIKDVLDKSPEVARAKRIASAGETRASKLPAYIAPTAASPKDTLIKRDFTNKFITKLQGNPKELESLGEREFNFSDKNISKLLGNFLHIVNVYIKKQTLTSPAANELLQLEEQNEDFSNLSLTSDIENANTSYDCFVGLLFPLLLPEVITKLFTSQSAIDILNSLSENYTGSLVNKLTFTLDTPIDFSNYAQITDDSVKYLLDKVDSYIFSSKYAQSKELIQWKNSVNRSLLTSIKYSTRANVLSKQELHNVTSTIYYQLLATLFPKDLDMFLLDPEKSSNINVKTSKNTKFSHSGILSNSATNTIYALKQLAEEDPAINRGLITRNARRTLNFDYAKRAGLLTKHKTTEKLDLQKTTEEYAKSKSPETVKLIDDFSTLIEDYLSNSVPANEDSIPQLKLALSKKAEEIINSAKNASALQLKTDTDRQLFEYIIHNFIGFQEIPISQLTTLLDIAAYNFYDETTEETESSDLTVLKDGYKKLQSSINDNSENIEYIAAINYLLNILDIDNKVNEIDRILSLKTDSALTDSLSDISSDEALETRINKNIETVKSNLRSKETTSGKHYQRSLKALKDIKGARVSAYSLVTNLEALPKFVSQLYADILKSIVNASEEEKEALKYSNNETKEYLSDFLSALVSDVVKKYFEDPTQPLAFLLRKNGIKITPAVTEYILSILSEYAETGSLITEPVVHTTKNLEELSFNFVNLLNFAAQLSTKKSDTPFSISASGEIQCNFTITGDKGANNYFNSYLMLDTLPSFIKMNPVLSLAYQRIFILSLIKPFKSLTSDLAPEFILSKEIIKKYPKLTQNITSFLNDIKSNIPKLDSLVSKIEHTILSIAGGRNIKIVKDNTKEPKIVYIPNKLGPDFKKALRSLIELPVLFSASVKSPLQTFAETSLLSLTHEEKEEELVTQLKYALIIMGTGINLRIAYSLNDSYPETVINKLQKLGDETIDRFNTLISLTKEKTTKLFNSFKEKTGLTSLRAGVAPISSALASLVLPFNIYGDIAEEAKQHEELINALAAANIGVAPGKTKEYVLDQLNVLYAGTFAVSSKELWSPETLATMESFITGFNLLLNEETTPEDANLVSLNSSGVVTINPEAITKSIINTQKSFINRVHGLRTGVTGKAISKKDKGIKTHPVLAYATYLTKLSVATNILLEKYSSIYADLGATDISEDVKEIKNIIVSNCEILKEFFDIISDNVNDSFGNDLFTMSIQTKLLNLLKTVKSITPKTNQGEEIYTVISQKLSSSNEAQERKKYLNTLGISYFMKLIGDLNLSFAEIKEGITKIIASKGDTLTSIADALSKDVPSDTSVSPDNIKSERERFLTYVQNIASNPEIANSDMNLLATLIDIKTIKTNILTHEQQAFILRILKGLSRKLPEATKTALLTGIQNKEFTNQLFGNTITEINPVFEEDSIYELLDQLETSIKTSPNLLSDRDVQILATFLDKNLYSSDPSLNNAAVKSRLRNIWKQLSQENKNYLITSVNQNNIKNLYTNTIIRNLEIDLLENISLFADLLVTLLSEAATSPQEEKETRIEEILTDLAAILYAYKFARVENNVLTFPAKTNIEGIETSFSLEMFYLPTVQGLPFLTSPTGKYSQSRKEISDVLSMKDANLFETKEGQKAVRVFDFNTTKAFIDTYSKSAAESNEETTNPTKE